MFATTKQRARDAGGWLTYKLIRLLLQLAIKVKRVKFTYSGTELLPRKGPYVLAIAPHTSFFDGPAMFPVVKRRWIGVGMAELLDVREWHVFSLLFRMMGHIPVQRDNKSSRVATLQAGIETLRRGMPVFIATEGGIDRPFWRDGYARMAWETKSPIVLVKLFGVREFMSEGPDEEWIFDWSAKVHVTVGAILDPRDYASVSDLHDVARAVHALIPPPA